MIDRAARIERCAAAAGIKGVIKGMANDESKKRYLVIGASGMVGHAVALYLQEQGNYVVGYSRRPAPIKNTVAGDVYDTDLLESTISEGDFDAIVNAAGLLVVDCKASGERAVYINAYLPHLLASLTEGTKTKIIQLSTDCIFEGNTGPYTEASWPDGRKLYARVKALGELDDGKNLTLRNSVVGPDINEGGIGLLNWFMKQEGSVDGWDKAIWTGLTTLELAKVIEAAMEHDATGVVNMVPEGPAISKYELLRLFNSYLRGSELEIDRTDYFDSDKTLVRTDFSLPYRAASYEDMVREMAKWIASHRDIYPAYYFRDSGE